MKIGIDARFWGQAGPGRYVKNLVSALEDVDSGNDYVVFVNSEGDIAYKPDRENFSKVRVDTPWYSFLEQVKLPFLFGRERLDLLHVPHFNIPVFYFGKLAVTIHDLTIHRFSTARATTRWRPFNLVKRAIYKAVVWLALRRAKVIFTPTEFVKGDLLKEYDWLDGEKIVVTYEGVDEKFRRELDKDKSQALRGVPEPGFGELSGSLSKYGVKEPYLLYVGSMYPHKNLERLIKAFSLVAEEYENLKLVLVGKRDYFQERLGKEIENNKYGILGKEKIVFPAFKVESGYVPDEDLAVFYKGALALVFPSLSEGFGLPPLEAMQFGVPVVASNATSIPEVCGAAALYFDPEDVEDIAAKIKALVKNESLREELVRKGFKNLERFSWQEMSLRTLKGYRMLN